MWNGTIFVDLDWPLRVEPVVSISWASCFFTGRMPFLSPKQQCQITEGKYHTSWTCLPQAHLGVFQLCLWPLVAPGYLGGGLPCLSSALWYQYPSSEQLTTKEFQYSLKNSHTDWRVSGAHSWLNEWTWLIWGFSELQQLKQRTLFQTRCWTEFIIVIIIRHKTFKLFSNVCWIPNNSLVKKSVVRLHGNNSAQKKTTKETDGQHHTVNQAEH